ncbi:TetR/AcrR family transcriptional regulator [Paenibacillus sp. PK3_47]|uniref:TetR/AcrR family transcriptional regulator n=1 Tax=Paenibacillus sp. PK3_47 TaxID=2072642 RepID=UPI00201DF9A0|nr:TetR/AcrR family transcriptional regulator [Paenibacillus sp. PK3_47]UQZ34141.1 TetR/AcrR family transcriptional regulator [Paenibacillus sp. PK3_47]
MNTYDKILEAALKVLEEDGGAQFSTRAVTAIAQVSAPTLYHHFGNADGLLSAAVVKAFKQLFESKMAAVESTIPETALRQGWDHYVRFAAARPRIYAAMMGRLLEGAHIEAADHSYQALVQNIQRVAVEGKLAVSAQTATDLVWASANTASWLYVTAQIRKAPPPQPDVVDLIRESVMQIILLQRPDADSK